MKYPFPTFILFLFSINLFSQEYLPLVVEDRHWLIGGCGTLASEENFFYEHLIRGDTTINDINYKKVIKRNFDPNDAAGDCAIFHGDLPKPYEIISQEYIGAIREDVEERKVYFLPASYPEQYCRTDLEEFLFFDFSTEIGDTISFCAVDEDEEGEPLLRTFLLSQVNVNSNSYGEERRAFYYESNENDSFLDLNLHEGFGTSLGLRLHWSLFMHVASGYHSVVDFCTGSDEECLFTLSAIKNPIDKNAVKIIPSPSNGYFEVKFEKNINPNTSLQIFNTFGELVSQLEVSSENIVVDLPLPSGFYFLSLLARL